VHATARVAALAALIVACVPALALAGASSGSMKVWAATSYIAPLSESDRNVGGVTAAVTGSNAMGYEFGIEFRKGSMGFAFDDLHSRQELQHATAGFLGSADFNPISASLMLHLPTPVLDLAAGVTASYVNWGDLKLQNGTTRPLDAKLGYGFTVSGDFALSKALALTGGMRWMKLQADPPGVGTVTMDPLVSHVGLALRF
jgi:hypothetical protein